MKAGHARGDFRITPVVAAASLLLAACVSTWAANVGTEKSHTNTPCPADTAREAKPCESDRTRAPGQITLEGVEVTQAIQDIESKVPLVAGKSTLVRVYLRYEGESAVTVRGELNVVRQVEKRDGAGNLLRDQAGNVLMETKESILPSANELTVSPADDTLLGSKRARLERSLYFVLPPKDIGAGTASFKLRRVTDTSTGEPLACPSCDVAAPLERAFTTVRPLRLRLVGFRYSKLLPSGVRREVAPSAADFDRIESWIRRAYPISRLEVTRIVVPLPTEVRLNCEEVNAELSTLRDEDIRQRVSDERTYYYGVVSDGAATGTPGYRRPEFMRGCASLNPVAPDASFVASGPTGVPVPDLFGWDTDGIYGDWYAGHEIAHLLGRKHPGKCSESQDDPEVKTQFIGDESRIYVGLDVGDSALSFDMMVREGEVWTDLMTYCDYQWISRHTYVGIYNRLTGASPAPASAAGAAPGDASLAGPGPSTTAPPPGAPAAERLALNQLAPADAASRASSSAAAGGDGGTQTSQPATPAGGQFVRIAAPVNVTKRTGRLPTPSLTEGPGASRGPSSEPPYPRAKVVLKGKAGATLGEYTLPILLNSDRDVANAEDVRGNLSGTVPLAEGTEVIELYLVGDEEGRPTEPTLLATYENDGTKPQVRNLLAKPSSGGAGVDASAFPLEITWEATGGAKVRYKVEVSRDGLKTDSPLKKWVTVANNLSENLTKIPRLDEQPAGLKEIQVRVTAYNGFQESITTRSIKLQ